MKLKSLLAVVSCTAFAVSISVPTIAEELKDNQITSQSSGIQNKEYGNKQSTPSMVGNWKAVLNEKGVISEIYINMKSDSTGEYVFQPGSSGTFNWNYSNNQLTEEYTSGESTGRVGRSLIKWISNDEFILTIVDNGDPYYEGVQRRYYRQSAQVSQQDKYGAFAVHGYGSHWGVAWDRSTPEAARNAAMKSCFEVSRGKCTPAVTFKNGCGALATELARYGSAAGVDELSAQHNALEVCGGEFCKIKKVVCNN